MAKMRPWTEDLPPYNADARCPKCGHDAASTHYRVAAKPRDPEEGCNREGYSKEVEHLDRQCKRCGYRWAEQVLAEPPPR